MGTKENSISGALLTFFIFNNKAIRLETEKNIKQKIQDSRRPTIRETVKNDPYRSRLLSKDSIIKNTPTSVSLSNVDPRADKKEEKRVAIRLKGGKSISIPLESAKEKPKQEISPRAHLKN